MQRSSATASLLLGFTPLAAAQVQHFAVYGPQSATLGYSLDALGDLTGDGVVDFVAGGQSYGAHVFSGADGALLHAVVHPSEWFGAEVSGTGDTNGDGVPDFLVTAPEGATANGVGYATLYSGADGSELYTLIGPAPTNEYGNAAAAVGDVDLDGYGDFVVADHEYDDAPGSWGLVHLVSGFDGSTLHVWSGTVAGGLGFDVTGPGDVDGDGVPDVLATAPHPSATGGRAYVFSGADGSVIHAIDGLADSFFGRSATGMGDLDGDGHADFAIATLGLYDTYIQHVTVYSGLDASELFTVPVSPGASNPGHRLAAGDVTGDGIADLLVASRTLANGQDANAGAVNGWSGADGTWLFEIRGEGWADSFGSGLAFLGDVNGDGRGDFAAAASGNDEGAFNGGKVRVFVTTCSSENYCVGALNSAGPGATIALQGSLSISENNTRLVATGAIPNQFAVFYYGPNRIQVAFGDGFRCVGGQVFRLPLVNAGPNGTPSYLMDLQALPFGSTIGGGEKWNFQCWYRDPGGPGGQGFNLSDAIELTFCP